MEGYNITLKVGTKTLCGRTQDDLSISARTKESLTKDDNGVTQKAVTGHDVSFKVSGLIVVDSSAATSKMDRDDIIALALSTGSSAVVAVRYECGSSGQAYGGNAIITGYSESSSASADEDATYSLDMEITGTFAVLT